MMPPLSLRIRIEGNTLVVELIEFGDQGSTVVASDCITREDLKAFLDE